VRYLVADDPDLHRQSAAILDPVRRGERSAVLREVAFSEIVFVLRRIYRVGKPEIVTLLSQVLDMLGLQGDDVEAMRMALDLFSKHSISIVDAMIMVHALRHRFALATFDRDLQRIAEAARLRVVS
jgi:predicted nucleic acid-binding protein